MKPRGSINCQECIRGGKDVCSGHYLPVEEIIEIERQGNTRNCCRPPREIIQCMVKENHSLSRDLLEKFAEECLLPIEEVEMCVDHYYQIVKRRKASGMNRRKSHASKEGKYLDFNNNKVLSISTWPKHLIFNITQQMSDPSIISKVSLTTLVNEINVKSGNSDVGLEEGKEISRNFVCNEPWKDRFVLQCNHCSCWFHRECVNVSEKDAEYKKERDDLLKEISMATKRKMAIPNRELIDKTNQFLIKKNVYRRILC
eukprot:Seg1510.11 transcript_id=Seg1510.11/GoldUCD/mRNA.D3Y31 product="hypothetical protein" protein_id=Seg1510.11/GoldUCD/D3Y31